jgi:hypothetical protein
MCFVRLWCPSAARSFIEGFGRLEIVNSLESVDVVLVSWLVQGATKKSDMQSDICAQLRHRVKELADPALVVLDVVGVRFIFKRLGLQYR